MPASAAVRGQELFAAGGRTADLAACYGARRESKAPIGRAARCILRPMRGRRRYALLSLLLFATEVLIATQLAHVPFVRGSLGDVLVVGLLYCLVLSLRDVDRPRLAAAVFLFACAVELTQYFELARLLGLRPGSVGWIVLGSTFQWTDILCYFVGCVAALVLDRSQWLRRGSRS